MKYIAISIIIPVFNSIKYLPACLNSVLSQTLSNIEVIIVDDASTDGSKRIIHEYAAQDFRITVLQNHISKGPGYARNQAMSIAKGEFIAFIDSDDLYPSRNVLEMLYVKAIKHNMKICGGSLCKVDSSSNIIKSKSVDFFTQEGIQSYFNYQSDGGFYCFIYNNDFIKKNNLSFPLREKFEDPIFFINTMLVAKKFYAISKYVYAYRKGHKITAWTVKKSLEHITGVIEILILSNTYCLEHLHYLMFKNAFESFKYRMPRICTVQRFIIAIKILKHTNIAFIKKENYKHKTNINIIRLFLRCFIFKREFPPNVYIANWHSRV